MICAASASTIAAEQTLRADGTVGVGPKHVGAFAGEQRLRAVTVDDRQHRAVAAPAARRPTACISGERRDLNAARRAEVQRRLHRAARIVGVDVHRVPAALPGRRDGHRLTEAFEPLAEQFDAGMVTPAEQIHDLELRGCPDDMVDLIAQWPGRPVLGPLRRVAGQRRGHRVEEDQQAPPSRVDHAGLGEHVELLGGLLQGDRCCFGCRSDDGHEVRAVARRILGSGGGGLQDRDDGAGHRLAHRGDRQADGMPQRGAQDRAVDVGEIAVALVGRLGGDVGEAAQDLRQDDARVAAGALQRALGERGGHRHHVDRRRRESARAHAARMVNSMFVPVSASATGKTLSRLISSVWAIRPPTAVWAQCRRVVASSRRADIPTSNPRAAACAPA